MKRLIFCFDGTWNKLDAQCPTNVVITAESIVPMARDGTPQQIFYHEGVGTGKNDRLRGGIFGMGLVPNLSDAYRTLIFNYTPGDEIYVFGFSRGAYTARSFVGLISNSGILHRSEAARADDAIALYRARNSSPEFVTSAMRFRSQYAPEVCVSEDEHEWRLKNCPGYSNAHRLQIAYLGVWDTVGALGIPARYRLLNAFNSKHQFHDTSLSSFVSSARHATAIDERRKDFQPTLWDNLAELNNVRNADIDSDEAPYQQRWFPGTHSSVGGGGDRRGLADQALEWVLDGSRHVGLELDRSERSPIFKLRPDSREYLADSEKPSFFYKAMTLVAAADRLPGPNRLSELSMSARRRWKEKAANLKDQSLYRPATLNALAGVLDTLSAENVGLDMPEVEAGQFTLYEVKFRDSLSKISQEHFGSAKFAGAIYRLNRDKLENIDRIYPGQLLRIPLSPQCMSPAQEKHS